MISLTCECGQSLEIEDEYAGQTGECPKCGKEIQIPSPQPMRLKHPVPKQMAVPAMEPPEQKPTVPSRRTIAVVNTVTPPQQEIAPDARSGQTANPAPAPTGLVQPKKVRDYYIGLLVLVVLAVVTNMMGQMGAGDLRKGGVLTDFCKGYSLIAALLIGILMIGIPIAVTYFTFRNWKRRGMAKHARSVILTNIGLLVGYLVVSCVNQLVANLAFIAIPVCQYIGIKKSVKDV